MPVTIKLSASSVKTFMSCRRKYWFEYVERLKPLARPVPLSFGGAVHAGLEKISQSNTFNRDAVMEAIVGSLTPDEIRESELNPELALEVCEAYFTHQNNWKAWRFISLEQKFEIPIGHGRRMRGRFDGIVEVDGNLFVLERKTVAGAVSERQLHNLMWDMQAGIYHLAAKELGYEIKGILYDFIPKPTIEIALATPVEKRKFTKDGRLYANQRDCDETPDEFLMRVKQWYIDHSGPEYFRQEIVIRNQNQIDMLIDQIKKLATDIRACERDESYYMNPATCQIMPCPFQGICLEDTPEVRSGNFTQKEERT